MNSAKLMIVDGNSILNRAFYGLKGDVLLATSGGLYTNAVYGFINILFKFIEEENPSYLCVAFDLKAPTFRHKEFDGYKANRKGMPDELAVQVPVIKDVLDAMNIKRLECEGYEADDIIGSVSLCAERKGMEVIVLTGDRDALQLASKTTRIKMPVTRSKMTETEEYDYDRVVSEYGITPLQFIEVKALMGDASDNIPGVKGIGEKTALDLIRNFKNIENLYDNLENVDKKGVRTKLENSKEIALLCRKLSAIKRDIHELCNMEELKRKQFDTGKLYQLFEKLEFRSLIERFDISRGKAPVSMIEELECINTLEELEGLKREIITSKEAAVYYLIDKDGDFEEKLIGIAFSCCKGKAAYVELGKSLNEDVFLTSIKDILGNENVKKYGHHMKNLIVYLKRKGIVLRGLSFDTMIAAYIINPSDNAYPVSRLAREHINKVIEPIEELTGKGKNYTPYGCLPVEIISKAAGTHAETVMELCKALDRILIGNEQKKLYYNIELPLIEVLADMEYHGFKVDIEGLKAFSTELEGKIDLLRNEIYYSAGEEFNINSTKQLGVILFEKLNLPVIKKTKTGYSTDAEVLEQLEPFHEIVPKILEYRQLMKLKSTYVEGLLAVINPSTGKIHSSFNQTVTATGRISSTEPNLQNIPIKLEMGRKIRKVFVTHNDEYILSDADYSQIELRVLAHITGDQNMIEAFKDGRDIHTTTASRVFGVPVEYVTPLLRSRAKAVNFGIVYGIGDFSLSKDLGISRKEARKYIDEYLDKYPGIRKYMHDIVGEAREKGYVATLFNRRRYLPELKSGNFNIRSFGERVALNMPIQGTAADIIKIAMVNIYKKLREENLKSRLILQVHDELLVETFIDEKDKVAEILKNSMENAVKLKVPLTVDVKTGSNWYETK